jgi:hypothetical protein
VSVDGLLGGVDTDAGYVTACESYSIASAPERDRRRGLVR